jgi:hypothetical protein
MHAAGKNIYEGTRPQSVIRTKPYLEQLGRQTAFDQGLKFVGSGRECIVVKYQNDDRLVTAFSYKDVSPEKARGIFYGQRVLSTIFPHNFPRFRASFPTDHINHIQGGTQRQQILKQDNSIIYPFGDKETKLRRMGINVDFDYAAVNFITGVDGGEYYVDIPEIGGKWNTSKILNYMNRNPNQDNQEYSDSDIKTVMLSIEHLHQIGFRNLI